MDHWPESAALASGLANQEHIRLQNVLHMWATNKLIGFPMFTSEGEGGFQLLQFIEHNQSH